MAWCYQKMDFQLPRCAVSHAASRQGVLEGLWSPSKQQSQNTHIEKLLFRTDFLNRKHYAFPRFKNIGECDKQLRAHACLFSRLNLTVMSQLEMASTSFTRQFSPGCWELQKLLLYNSLNVATYIQTSQ